MHTGQHYDELMSDCFFADLNLPKPDVHLGLGSCSHAVQVAEIMKRFEEVLVRECPDVLIVVGDVNSTLACALTAAKIPVSNPACRPLVAHMEAGLRSFDRSMPEEHNRVLTDLLFVTERSGLENLRREGIRSRRIHFVSNTMIDTLLAFRERVDASAVLQRLGLQDGLGKNRAGPFASPYALLTLHRPSNVDSRGSFINTLEGLKELSHQWPIVFPVHPRTRTHIKRFGLEQYFAAMPRERAAQTAAHENGSNGIVIIDPLGYLDFLCLMKHALLVLTDSGGIQEETTCLGVPCVTIRENTELPITAQCGTNIIAGVTEQGIRNAIRRQLARKTRKVAPEKWDGRAGLRIIKALVKEFRTRHLPTVPWQR